MRTKVVLKTFSAKARPVMSTFIRSSWQTYAMCYLQGIILLSKFRSISEIARRVAGEQIDIMHHFLCHSPWQETAVWAAHQQQVAHRASQQAKPVLIIDDTATPREGSRIEGQGVHHSADGLVRGVCAVTAVVKLGSLVLSWCVTGYRPKNSCAPQEFKSKIELALDIVEGARILGSSVTVLFDAWYACKRVLNTIAGQGWRYVAAIKTNRVILVNGRKTLVRHLAKGPRRYVTVQVSKKRTFRAAKAIVQLPGVGQVALFITKTTTGGLFLISNDLELSPTQAVKLYAQRFTIETFHRDMKQYLGLGELWMRSWRGSQRHWLFCAVAYNSLQFWNMAQPRYRRKAAFGQIVRYVRETVSVADACHERNHQMLNLAA